MRIVTFGEIMLRLKSPNQERFLQSPNFEATFGGGEANVAVSLANFGMDVCFVTALPNNALADACIKELRGYNVDINQIKRTAGRMGIYFLEGGANQRPSLVVYDRAESSLALAGRETFDWCKIFTGADWFHITGITPAISEKAADISLDAIKTAKTLGLMVSIDLNYRKNLWKYGKNASDIMKELLTFSDVCIANEEDIQKSLSIQTDLDTIGVTYDESIYKKLCEDVFQSFPNLKLIAITLRESINANQNNWSACLHDGKNFFVSEKFVLSDIVDRVGGGDSFCGGLIFALINGTKPSQALEFAVAASCLKHSIYGDFNRVTIGEVNYLMNGDKSGRVKR